MRDGRTHWEGCYKEYGHKDCALDRIERLQAKVEALEAALTDIQQFLFKALDATKREALAATEQEGCDE